MTESSSLTTTPKNSVRYRDISVADQVMRSVSHLVPELKKLVTKSDSTYLMSRYRIGALLVDAKRDIDSAEDTARIYRKDFWQLFGEAIGMHPRTLRYCLKFANEFTQADVEKLAKANINWSHVTIVLGLPDSENRAEWLQRVAAENLTVDALDDEVRAKYDNRRPGSGRKPSRPRPPKSVKLGVERARERVSRLNLEHQHALFSDDYDLSDRIMHEDADDELRRQVDDLIDEYELLACAVAAILPDLINARRQMDRRPEDGETVEVPSGGDGTMPTDPAPAPQRTRRPPPTLRVVAPPTA